MWIIYIVVALFLATGTGLFLQQDTDVQIRDIARLQAPQVQADEANRIARYLRRMYQDNPSQFPARPSNGAAPVLIPGGLVNRAMTQGNRVPDGVQFLLDSGGNILAVFTNAQGPRGDLVAGTLNRVIERDGGNTGVYSRVENVDRTRTFGTISRNAATTYAPGVDGSRSILVAGGGADALLRARNEATTAAPIIGNWSDGTNPYTGGDDNGPTQPPLTPLPGTGGTAGSGGGNGSGGGTRPGDGADRASDFDPITGLDDLMEGGGTGGSTQVDVASYSVSGGNIIINRGFETVRGPRSDFFSAVEIAQSVADAQANNYRLRSRIVRLNFADTAAGANRIAAERAFDNACTAILNRVDRDLRGDFETMLFVVERYLTNSNISDTEAREKVEVMEANYLVSAMYCMSVYRDRGAPKRYPIRANMAHVQNESALNMAGTGITTWTTQYNRFMALNAIPPLYRYQNSSGGREEILVDRGGYSQQLELTKTMIAEMQALIAAVQSYPNPGAR